MDGRRSEGARRNRKSGATAIEYALIAGGVALVIVAAVNLVGTNVNTLFTTVAGGF